MNMRNQSGFGVVGVLVALLVVVAAATAGWFVYDKQQSKKDAKQEAAVSQATSNNGSGVAMNGYLGIPELGIQLKLADGVKDATYAVMADGSTIGLSTQSLVDQYGDSCKASSGSVAQVAALVAPTPPYGGTGSDDPAAYKNSYKTADQVYYVIKTEGLSEPFCGGALAASSTQAQQIITGFKDTGIQALQQ